MISIGDTKPISHFTLSKGERCEDSTRLMTGGFTLLQVCEIGILVFLEPSPLRELPHAADVSGETTTFPPGKRAHCLSHRRRRRSDEARLVASYSRAKWSSGGRPPRLSAHARMVEAFRVAKSTHSPGPGQLLRAQRALHLQHQALFQHAGTIIEN